jgi:hypothetical protein
LPVFAASVDAVVTAEAGAAVSVAAVAAAVPVAAVAVAVAVAVADMAETAATTASSRLRPARVEERRRGLTALEVLSMNAPV